MHYPTLTNATLSLPVWIGNISGCLFSLWWLQRVMRMSYIRLGIIGSVVLLGYLVMMYLMVSPSISIGHLCAPLFCHGFAYTTLSIVFMASLHDVIDFNHFFQGLGVFNMIHMVIGGCMGCAIFAWGLNNIVADSFMRYTSPSVWLHSATPIGSAELTLWREDTLRLGVLRLHSPYPRFLSLRLAHTPPPFIHAALSHGPFC